MSLRQPNVERMLLLDLAGMAEAPEEQRSIVDIDQLDFDGRLTLMLEREVQHRDHRSCLGHLRQVQRRRPGRRLPRRTRYRANHANSTRRQRLDPPDLQPDPHRPDRLRKDLPGLRPGPSGLLEEEVRGPPARARTRPRPRQGTSCGGSPRSPCCRTTGDRRTSPPRAAATCLRSSSRSPWNWPGVIVEPTIAIHDRIVHNAYRIEIAGESRRRRNRPHTTGRCDRSPDLNLGDVMSRVTQGEPSWPCPRREAAPQPGMPRDRCSRAQRRRSSSPCRTTTASASTTSPKGERLQALADADIERIEALDPLLGWGHDT